MNKLNCQKINRKCANDIQINVQTVVLNDSVWQYLTWHQVSCTRFPCVSEILAVFKLNIKM